MRVFLIAIVHTGLSAARVAVVLFFMMFIIPACAGNAVQPPDAAQLPSERAGITPMPARSLNDIASSGKLVIGVYSDKPPFAYLDAFGKYQGFEIYFAERLAKDLGVLAEYVAVEPSTRIESLEAGAVDIVLASFSITPGRAERVDFALPYLKSALGVVSPESVLITDISQLVGKKLIVAKGTTAESYFAENYPGIELLKFDHFTEVFEALLEGLGDAFSTNNTDLLAWSMRNPGFIVGIPLLGDLDLMAPAVQKGNTGLLGWVNEEIVSLAEEQFFHKDYTATLASTFGAAVNPDAIVIEGGDVGDSSSAPFLIPDQSSGSHDEEEAPPETED